MPTGRVPPAVPIAAIVIGALFAIVALARPSFLWEMGKVRAGREWIGDTGVTIFFLVIGLAVAAAGTALLLKKPAS